MANGNVPGEGLSQVYGDGVSGSNTSAIGRQIRADGLRCASPIASLHCNSSCGEPGRPHNQIALSLTSTLAATTYGRAAGTPTITRDVPITTNFLMVELEQDHQVRRSDEWERRQFPRILVFKFRCLQDRAVL
jgi:hypothetical protein